MLVVRVHKELLERQKLPQESRDDGIWKRRYREINDWERYLTDNGIKRREAVPQPVEGGAARPLPAPDRPPRPQLEVLVGRRAGARVLGRLPARVLGDALAHEHRVGPVARDPGRPQVVRADRRGCGDRERTARDRPPLPDGEPGDARRPAGDQDDARERRRPTAPLRIRSRRASRATSRRRHAWPISAPSAGNGDS